MENSKILNHQFNLVVFFSAAVVAVALTRLLPHPPNLTPLGGLALFAGANIGGLTGFILPLASMLISDLILGLHITMPYVYLSFALIVLLGKSLKKFPNFLTLLGYSLLSSFIFYLVTNFGVWASTDLYPKTLSGLYLSYFMGLPFFRNTIMGDLIYSTLFFYGYFGMLVVFRKKFTKKVIL